MKPPLNQIYCDACDSVLMDDSEYKIIQLNRYDDEFIRVCEGCQENYEERNEYGR